MNTKNIIRYLVPFVVLITLVYFVRSHQLPFMGGDTPKSVPYSTFVTDIEHGWVSKGKIEKTTFTVTYADKAGPKSGEFTVDLPDNPQIQRDLDATMRANHVDFNYPKPPIPDGLLGILVTGLLPLLAIVFIWVFFLRQAQSGGNQAMSFGRSKAKRLTDSRSEGHF